MVRNERFNREGKYKTKKEGKDQEIFRDLQLLLNLGTDRNYRVSPFLVQYTGRDDGRREKREDPRSLCLCLFDIKT